MSKYLAFDIGGTFIKYGLVTEKAEILENHKVKTPKTLDELLSVIEELSGKYSDVKGIAISAPGAVSDEGVIYGSSAIPYLHGPNIKNLVSEITSLPVYLENDANCAGYAELWNGAAKGKKDVLVMVIGTGIGGSVFKNGQLHKGAHLHGGEFGYMLLTGDIQDSNDVWSRVASTAALVRNVAKRKQIGVESISGEEIFQLAESGDEDCIEAIHHFYHLLAVGIYNLQYIYDPEVIVIGGGISARDELIDGINEKLDSILARVDLAKIKPEIVACMHRQNANLLGAVYGAMHIH
ncbi:ROK family protein [Neobacillus niacini]|uniref:ROK family protein n=1 Tax=Neobacillus niacini TaxID=86668 RepID=UPI00052FC471|nr:ROK family protein [Neobacillus niacini]KGM44733.1 sugar kinase [Neobacillus niacini]MEC1522202.1 ROK family protein [Neobacillus niacini]